MWKIALLTIVIAVSLFRGIIAPIPDLTRFNRAKSDLVEVRNQTDLPTDPWGSKYLLISYDDTNLITSKGPDGRWGTSDDISESTDGPGWMEGVHRNSMWKYLLYFSCGVAIGLFWQSRKANSTNKITEES